MVKVYIGIGSNESTPVTNINKAIYLISKQVKNNGIKISKSYKTSPVLNSSISPINKISRSKQNYYINAVIELKTNITPKRLLITLKKIERQMGRKHSNFSWSPRIIDLDILFYGNKILKQKIGNDYLIIPHQRIQERKFVLKPMLDLNSYFIHPVYNKNMLQLYRSIKNKTQKVTLLVKE